MKTVAAGIALFVMAGSFPEGPPSPGRDRTLRFSIDALDRRVQARFADVTEEDARKGDFGASRYAALGLRAVIRPDLHEERGLVIRIEREGWSFAQFIVNPEGTVIGPISSGAGETGPDLRPRTIADLALRSMRTRAPLAETRSGVSLDVRPIVAGSAKCAGCHDGAAPGDPLGAVVYAAAPRSYRPASSPSR